MDIVKEMSQYFYDIVIGRFGGDNAKFTTNIRRDFSDSNWFS